MSSKASDGQPELWWRSEPQEVAPAVHRIPLPLPDGEGLRAVNVYVIEADSGLTLVDAGWATDASRVALERGLSRLGHCLDHVERFLVTHVHPDHYTQAVAVRRAVSGVRVDVGNAAIGRPAVVLTVTVPAVIEAHAVTVPVVDGHLRWRPRLSSKN